MRKKSQDIETDFVNNDEKNFNITTTLLSSVFTIKNVVVIMKTEDNYNIYIRPEAKQNTFHVNHNGFFAF